MGKPLAKRIRALAPSQTVAITSRLKELVRAGVDAIALSIGEPDFDTPQHIKEAAIKAIMDGKTKYTPAAGVPELRETICEKLLRDNGVEYSPDEIIVTCGGKQALYNALQVLCDEGDEVIVASPYWVTYPESVKLAGAYPRIVEGRQENDFKITPEQLKSAITPRTKAFILNSPSNPTGTVYTKEEIIQVAEICYENGIYLISDEIYEKIIYDGAEHFSPASISPDIKKITILLNGVSKTYAMTGWRIGYAAADKELVKGMVKLQSQLNTHPSSIAQYASIAALRGDEKPIREMVRQFAQRRDYCLERIEGIEGMSCPKPKGAFYIFPEVRNFFLKGIKNSVEFAQYLLDKVYVGVVPGSAFGADGYIRISYATSIEELKEAFDRIENALRELTR